MMKAATRPRLDHTGNSAEKEGKSVRNALLKWYGDNKRDLPWRTGDGDTPDPYRIWLSEIMLQQTTVAAVIPYFEFFTQRWPDVESLAGADIQDITKAWAGLGYYARARNLHKCAQIIAGQHGGQFPRTLKELRALPGIGEYTSAAILSIAFGVPAVVIDGNVERILSRLFMVQETGHAAKKQYRALVAPIYINGSGDKRAAADLPQAFMDLGARICTPKNPSCCECPIKRHCSAFKNSAQEIYPLKLPKKQRPHKYGHAYWVKHPQTGDILIQKRPDKGLLGGMLGLPTSDWAETEPSALLFAHAVRQNITVNHVFTHFSLDLYLYTATALDNYAIDKEEYFWLNPENIRPEDFPTAFKKAVHVFLRDSS